MFGSVTNKEGNWQRAETLLDRARPGDFNQAMMDLGATVCTPRAPQCLLCPLYKWCQTRGADSPGPQPARNRKQVRYAWARRGEAILLVQRPADAKRMAGMWELPERATAPAEESLAKFRHSITDTDYEVSVVTASPDRIRSLDGDARWFTRKQWQKLALTGLTRKILHKLTPGAPLAG
jgi:A/G-specific adenine glycosylase